MADLPAWMTLHGPMLCSKEILGRYQVHIWNVSIIKADLKNQRFATCLTSREVCSFCPSSELQYSAFWVLLGYPEGYWMNQSGLPLPGLVFSSFHLKYVYWGQNTWACFESDAEEEKVNCADTVVSKAVVVGSPAGGMCGCLQKCLFSGMRILPVDVHKLIWGKNALKPRAIQPDVSTMTSAKEW